VADFERARSVLASPRYARPAKGSLTTIAKHLERIYEKLGVESRTAAAMRAMRG
jgi:DNA-binding CsgD family transcriptional regulator